MDAAALFDAQRAIRVDAARNAGGNRRVTLNVDGPVAQGIGLAELIAEWQKSIACEFLHGEDSVMQQRCDQRIACRHFTGRDQRTQVHRMIAAGVDALAQAAAQRHVESQPHDDLHRTC
jgi:hypothetical protein